MTTIRMKFLEMSLQSGANNESASSIQRANPAWCNISSTHHLSVHVRHYILESGVDNHDICST